MRFSRDRSSRGATINVTSLIDVMFLLVIFVLLSAKFEPEGGIAVDLPKGKLKEVARSNTYKLTIMYEGTMFLRKKKVAGKELAAEVKRIRAEFRQQGRADPVLVIEADKDVSWERIVTVTEDAKLAGQSRVNFRIRP